MELPRSRLILGRFNRSQCAGANSRSCFKSVSHFAASYFHISMTTVDVRTMILCDINSRFCDSHCLAVDMFSAD